MNFHLNTVFTVRLSEKRSERGRRKGGARFQPPTKTNARSACFSASAMDGMFALRGRPDGRLEARPSFTRLVMASRFRQ